MNVKKIDVPNKLYEYRDELKKEHEIVGKFKRFDIVYVEKIREEPFIAIISDYEVKHGYVIKYLDENGSYCSIAWIAKDNMTLVERQETIYKINGCDI